MIFISVDTSQIRYSLEKLAEIGVKYHQKFGMVTKEFAISASNVPRTLINTWSPPNPDPTTLPGITRTFYDLAPVTLNLIGGHLTEIFVQRFAGFQLLTVYQ